MNPFPWTEYSNKLTEKILNPKNFGAFASDDGKPHGMRLVIGEEGSIASGNHIRFYLLVDEEDGVIADLKYQAFGDPALIGAAEFTVEILLRKNYDQARRVSAEMIDHRARDFAHIPAFPKELSPHLNLILSAIENGVEKCSDIPLSNPYESPPVPSNAMEMEEYPGWEILSPEEKLEVIRNVIQEEVQPYIALDAGGVQVLKLNQEKEVIIAYEGACTTCPSSVGATLQSIEQILKAKIHGSLTVTPDPSFLNLSPS